VEESFEIGRPDPEPERLHPLYRIIPLAMSLLAFILTPNFLKARAGSSMPACESNCNNLATALSMYAGDNHGLYPRQLADLTSGNYFKLIPTCPATGKDTYSISYEVSSQPPAFSFVCKGNNHAKKYAVYQRPSDNYPRYSSWSGLDSHP
jgi:hypothetical protein